MLLFSGERLLLDKVSLQLSIFVRDSVLKDKIKWTLHVAFPLPGFCYYIFNNTVQTCRNQYARKYYRM